MAVTLEIYTYTQGQTIDHSLMRFDIDETATNKRLVLGRVTSLELSVKLKTG